MSRRQGGEQQNGQGSAPASDPVDQQLAAEAVRKLTSKETPTAREQEALKRVRKKQDEERRRHHYRTIPQKHWKEMSGRQTKVLQEQAELYGIPFGGAIVDLFKVVRAIHDFLAANARKLAAPDEDLMQAGGPSPALEEYRIERTKIARLERQKLEGSLLPRDVVRERLGRVAANLKTAGDNLQRQFGNEASEILLDAVAESLRDIDRYFGGEDSHDTQPDSEPEPGG